MSREGRAERQGWLFVEDSLRWEQLPAATQVRVQELLMRLLLEVMESEAVAEPEGVEDV